MSADDVSPPHARLSWIGDPAVERSVRDKIVDGAFSHGWLLVGPDGVGKATFAYRAARAILSDGAFTDSETLAVAPSSQSVKLIAAQSHPDLFVAARQWDEKKGRFETEIPVDTIRKLTAFMQRTPGLGGWRVALIDSADELNRNAANALLKVLEEPPPRTVLMLLTSAPGRLIATIRSRCRRLELRPVEDAKIERFLTEEGVRDDVAAIAAASKGRPGYALELASGAGGGAIALVDDFFRAAGGARPLAPVIQSVTGKAGDALWPTFSAMVVEAIADAARGRAGATPGGAVTRASLSDATPDALLKSWEEVRELVRRSDAVNLDRGQTVLAMARRVRNVARSAA